MDENTKQEIKTIKRSTLLPLLAITAIAGMAMGLGYMTHAQSSTSTSNSSGNGNIVPGVTRGHMPLGNDGNVTAINGTTITMQEEADEGGASYTVNAANAAITKNGAAGQLSDIKVGDKIFVQGTVSGTNVQATAVSAGFHGGKHGFHGGMNDGPSNLQ